MERVDFVVIGGGIAGASAGYELAAHGKVVLMEAEATTGHHTTGRSAALFTEAYEEGPVRALTRGGRSFLEQPPEGFDTILTPIPVLLIGRPDQRAAVEAVAASAGPLVEVLDEPGARRVCPILREGYVAAATYETGSRSIDVHALHQGFLSGVRRRGGTVRVDSRVEELRYAAGTWTVGSDRHRVEAPVVVNAAGAWCDLVGALAGAAPIGLQPYRRTAFTFAAPDGIDVHLLPMVIDVDEEFYFKPEGPQFLGSLAEETPMPPHDVRPEEADVALAIERIEAATTMHIRHVRSSWAGLRSFVADRLPVAGEDPDRPGFFWLAGQGGFGIMTSPALGRALAGLVVGGALPADLLDAGLTGEALSPGRMR